MKTVGIICEYNPLHRGHMHQIQLLRQHGVKCVVCVMSSSFVQRGEIAIYDKFTRARWALQAGADVVFELPCVYSLQNAECFAKGAISILDGLGIIDGFGSETEDLLLLNRIAQLHQAQPPAFTQALQRHLSSGMSHPAAKQAATEECLGILDTQVFSPNATLGIEYIKAALSIGSKMQPIPLLRNRALDSLSSSECRRNILSGKTAEGLPDFVQSDLSSRRPLAQDVLFNNIAARLLYLRPEGIAQLPDVTEGLENRIYSALKNSSALEEFYCLVSTKRYPLARIKRILCCALLGITREFAAEANEKGPQYARPLAIRYSEILSVLSASSRLPLLTRPVEYRNHPLFKVELFATDLHSFFSGQPIGQDFTAGILKAE